VKLEVTVNPDDSISKEVKLERLPLASLQEQAAKALNERRYNDTLKLCQYIFESDPANPAGHQLAGQVYLERGDFGNAGSHFAKALSGGESVTLRVRRHSGEKFDFNKGHDLCEARLILAKSEVEFQGTRVATDNFKVPYDQIQVIGLQLKNNRASYLGTKVNVAGKRHDFNFYSYDNELSQTGKPYLEMIQGLLRSH
jgi:tetratricopeptide (TPR) repeat protein